MENTTKHIGGRVSADTAAHALWLGKPAPRYTSYPPATQFRPLPDGARPPHLPGLAQAPGPVSLYIHIPFCRALCLFCGCHSVITNRADRIEAYLQALHQEIRLVSRKLECPLRIAHLHFGGGSPSILSPAQFHALMQELRAHFAFEATAELAMELDPRTVTPALVAALAEEGINRASLGVQDFDVKVQELIHRVQPYEVVRESMEMLRQRGIHALSLDLMYGLPGQTPESVAHTTRRAVGLKPERVSLFSYAHVPNMKPYQKKLEQAGLPDDGVKLQMEQAARKVLMENGFIAIGIDHFARPDDSLALALQRGTLSRNFQGYTDDPAANCLLGLGVSAISDSGEALVQNDPDVLRYQRCLAQGELPLKRFCLRTPEDRCRADLIRDLMCRFEATIPEDITPEPGRLEPFLAAGLTRWDGNRLVVDQTHRMAVRVVATAFDPTFRPEQVSSRVA